MLSEYANSIISLLGSSQLLMWKGVSQDDPSITGKLTTPLTTPPPPNPNISLLLQSIQALCVGVCVDSTTLLLSVRLFIIHLLWKWLHADLHAEGMPPNKALD